MLKKVNRVMRLVTSYLTSGMSRSFVFLAELQQPKGPQAWSPIYPYRKSKETGHELICSWLSWLVVLLVGEYARHKMVDILQLID